jgi:hypothetical protein
MQKSTKRFVTIALALASVAGVSLLGGFASQADGAGAAVNFTVSPSASTGGVTFPDQPVVTLSGVGATANALVTLTISTGPGTLTCTGGTTLNAVNFIASFSGCSIDKAANGYVLKAADATDGGSNTSTSFDITAGTAYKLGFTTQPVSGSAGDLFVGGNIGSPVVTIEDEGGNPAASNPTDNSTSVTLVIAPNPGQGTLNCTNSNPVVVSSGVAIFGLCAINKEDPGSGYTLLASATGLLASELIPEFSDNFDVTYTTAVASQLVFTNQPAPGANETVNASTFPIDVSLEDTFGNLERNNSATDVELSFTGAGTLGCTGEVGLEASTSQGTADFTDCSANTAQTNAQITASTNNDGHVPNGVTSVGSDLFNVVEPATHLVFTTQPGNGSASTPISPPPVVNIEGAGGATADSTDLVTLTIGSNPGGGVLSCPPVSAVAGVATFANCSINAAGIGYTLVATDSTNPGTITAATSSTFDITAGGTDHLVFTIEPGNGAPGHPLSAQPSVAVENASNVPVASSDAITLTISTNPGTGTLTCTSNPASAVVGVATFSRCAVNNVGTGYVLTATDTTDAALSAAVSSPFTVSATTPLPTQIFGPNSIGTAIAVSQAEFPIPGSAHVVVLARSDFFSDALAGGPLAAALNGPLLITPGADMSSLLDPGVEAEIQRVLPVGDTVYILGGTVALSPNIDTTLESLGYSVVREAGIDEYGTAVDIAVALGNPTTIFEAPGLSFYDALSSVPAAIGDHGAILLTDGSTQDPETAAYLAAHPTDNRYAIGGTLAALGADPSAIGVFGADAYATSAAVANFFFPAANCYAVATGLGYTDALAGGVFMATGGRLGPILLVDPSVVPAVPAPVATYLGTLSVGTQGYVIGGPLAIPAPVLTAIQADVG